MLEEIVKYTPLIGVFADSLDYLIRYPFALHHRISSRIEDKKIDKKDFNDFIENRLEDEVRIIVNRYNATKDNIEDIGPLHRQDNISLLPIMCVALDNGTLESYFFLKKKTNVSEVYLFCFGGDKTFNNHHMLKHLPDSVTTIIEKDYSAKALDLEKLFRALYKHIKSNAGLTSFYIKPMISGAYGSLKDFKEKAITAFQNHEYSLSMNFGKRFLDGCTIASGAFAVYKRSALERIISRSSHNVLGEDYENSLLLFSDGEISRHDPSVEVETIHPKTAKRLDEQRKAWKVAQMRCLYDHLFMPLGRTINDILGKNNAPKGILNRVKKISTDLKFCYQHYIHAVFLENMIMPLKIVAAGALIASGLNYIDNINEINMIPEYIRLSHDYAISLRPKMIPLYLGSLIGLNAFHVLQSDEKGKLKRLPTCLGFPFYKLSLLYSDSKGFIKGINEFIESFGEEKSHNRFEQLNFAHTIYKPDFMNRPPKSKEYHKPLDELSQRDLTRLIESLDINKRIKKKLCSSIIENKREAFTNVIYKTIYHDFLIADTDEKYRSTFDFLTPAIDISTPEEKKSLMDRIKSYIERKIDNYMLNKNGETNLREEKEEKNEIDNLLGIVDLVDIELAMYSIKDTTSLLGYHLQKEDLRTPLKISAVHQGYIIPAGNNKIAVISQSRVATEDIEKCPIGPSQIDVTLYRKKSRTILQCIKNAFGLEIDEHYSIDKNRTLMEGESDAVPMTRKYKKLEIINKDNKDNKKNTEYPWHIRLISSIIGRNEEHDFKHSWLLDDSEVYTGSRKRIKKPLLPYSNN